jgi:glutamine synthetase
MASYFMLVCDGLQNVEEGADQGTQVLAAKDNFQDTCTAEYIWVDGWGVTRSKSRTLNNKPACADDAPIWLFNGSGCGQAGSRDSDVYLVPREIFDDPFRGRPNVLVMAEAVTVNMEPAEGNWRAECIEQLRKYERHDFWFGIEQEYTLCKVGTMGEDGPPLGTDEDGMYPAEKDKYYCAVGGASVCFAQRQIMEDHYACCMAAGVKIAGMNCERGFGQSEFQVGPCRAWQVGDHLTVARWILHICADRWNASASFAPRIEKSLCASGMHINMSTNHTRADGGMDAIDHICRGLMASHNSIMNDPNEPYGTGHDQRLVGNNELSNGRSFKYGVGDRTCSVRVPRNVAVTGKGYLEDRRPASDADPFQAIAALVKGASAALNTMK